MNFDGRGDPYFSELDEVNREDIYDCEDDDEHGAIEQSVGDSEDQCPCKSGKSTRKRIN